MNNNITSELYQKLRQHRGAFGEIVRKTGRSRQWVRLVLQGGHKDYRDTKVVKVAVQVLAQKIKEKEEVGQQLNEVVTAADQVMDTYTGI